MNIKSEVGYSWVTQVITLGSNIIPRGEKARMLSPGGLQSRGSARGECHATPIADLYK